MQHGRTMFRIHRLHLLPIRLQVGDCLCKGKQFGHLIPLQPGVVELFETRLQLVAHEQPVDPASGVEPIEVHPFQFRQHLFVEPGEAIVVVGPQQQVVTTMQRRLVSRLVLNERPHCGKRRVSVPDVANRRARALRRQKRECGCPEKTRRQAANS